MKPSRRDAIVALAGLPALLALEACDRGDPAARYDGAIVGGNDRLGHLLRSGDLLGRPVARRERTGTAILGAGVSGLSAAWRLLRDGDRDFKVYELEAQPGGTAQAGTNDVSPYPWGAHYVPVPVGRNPALETLLEEVGALVGREPDGSPVFAEDVLCREPEERLFHLGQWAEGLYPRAGASRADLAELKRFEETMRGFAAARDDRGRRAFAVPRRLSSGDSRFTDLDRTSMDAWLSSNGFTSERLRWLVEYGCRDDFGTTLAVTSAWAGIHYFASRLRGTGRDEEPAAFLSWPEGNGRLVSQLAKSAAARLVTGALVFDVATSGPGGPGVTVRFLDSKTDEVVEVEARDAVFALPRFMASRLFENYRRRAPQHLAAFSYSPWVVANLTLKDRPKERGFPLAWDNVLHGSPSLGYVVATHQAGRDRGPTVFTWYRPFAGESPSSARGLLLASGWKDLAAGAVADLARAHRDLPALVSRVDVWRWGHAMVRPTPGTLFGEALATAARPLGRVRFAHTDLSGLPLFEEAQDSGVRAAENILASRGARVSSLLA